MADLLPIRLGFVWWKDGEARIVADAKCKAEKPSGFPQAHLHQMLAYCTSLGLPVGHLVYAKGNEDAREHVVRGSGVCIIAHALELDAPTAAVLNGISSLGQAMFEGVTQWSGLTKSGSGVRFRSAPGCLNELIDNDSQDPYGR